MLTSYDMMNMCFNKDIIELATLNKQSSFWVNGRHVPFELIQAIESRHAGFVNAPEHIFMTLNYISFFWFFATFIYIIFSGSIFYFAHSFGQQLTFLLFGLLWLLIGFWVMFAHVLIEGLFLDELQLTFMTF